MTLERVTMVAVRRLRPNKRNARTHSKKQIRQLADVIRQFGWTYPILVDEDSSIICGHGRWEAAKELGLKEVPVLVRGGLSDAEKRALALADNKIAMKTLREAPELARPMLAEFRQQYRRINVQFTVESVVEVEAQLFRGHPEVVEA
jgi:ParB/RepB/Spo0J family partition protein